MAIETPLRARALRECDITKNPSVIHQGLSLREIAHRRVAWTTGVKSGMLFFSSPAYESGMKGSSPRL